MKAALLLSLSMAASGPWDAPPTVSPQWVGKARPKPKEPIRRIVTVAPSITETLFALGFEDRVVGVSRFDDRPPRIKKLPSIGGFADPNVEAIFALKPDLVLAAANATVRPSLERLATLGVPVYVLPGNSLADVAHATRAMAKLLDEGAPARGHALLNDLERALKPDPTTAKGPKVLVVFGLNPLIAAGPGSLTHAVLTRIGARNAAPKGSSAYPQLSAEVLVAQAPDVIIDATGAHGQSQRAPWEGLTSIPAVKRNRIEKLPLAVLLRPSPRLAEGVAVLKAHLRARRSSHK